MFTLPDFCLKKLNTSNVAKLYTPNSSRTEVLHEVRSAEIMSHETWMPIKGNSTPLRLKKSDNVMGSLRPVYENALLKGIMSRIDQTLTPSSSEKTSD
jgi:hypothetical protein